jgi:crotonobetainyl-CoA:carnitine CoA-transferase CaiB-like acyl-CoA transferase
VPIRFSAEPAQPRFQLPRLGADNDRILESLGYSAEDRSRLRAEGAISGGESA